MQLNRVHDLLALCALASLGCGPSATDSTTQDWMIGWFSDASPDLPLSHSSATNINIREDNTAEVLTLSDCSPTGNNDMVWHKDGDSAVRLVPAAGSEDQFDAPFGGYKLYRNADCGEYELTRIWDGNERDPKPMRDARLCMTLGADDPDCIGSGCNRCYKTWCEDTEPASCDDEQ